MLKHLALIVGFMSSAAMADVVYKGEGAFIASNGITGTWIQTVTVSASEEGVGMHLLKDSTFTTSEGQSYDYTFEYDLRQSGTDAQTYDIVLGGRSVGTANCRGNACFYKADAPDGFDLDTGITKPGKTYHKIGMLKTHWTEEEMTVHYEGEFVLQE